MPRVAKPRAAYYDFTWTVPKIGFRWYSATTDELSVARAVHPDLQSTGTIDQPVLLPASPLSETNVAEYKPLQEYTGLFLTFAELSPTPEVIERFANRYGVLEQFEYFKRITKGTPRRRDGVPGSMTTSTFGEAPSGSTITSAFGEAMGASWLSTWVREIGHLRYLAEEAGFLGDSPNRGFKSSGERRGFVLNDVNMELDVKVADHLQVAVDERDIQLMPVTLLGAIWLQFALAVAKGKQYRRCAASDCPRGWFEISREPFGLRPEAKYCSKQCRNRVWAAGQQQE